MSHRAQTNPSREKGSAEALPVGVACGIRRTATLAEMRAMYPTENASQPHEQRSCSEFEDAARYAPPRLNSPAIGAQNQAPRSTPVPPISAWEARPYGPVSGDESPGNLEQVAADFRAEKARLEAADRRFFWALTAGLCCIAVGLSLILLAMLRS